MLRHLVTALLFLSVCSFFQLQESPVSPDGKDQLTEWAQARLELNASILIEGLNVFVGNTLTDSTYRFDMKLIMEQFKATLGECKDILQCLDSKPQMEMKVLYSPTQGREASLESQKEVESARQWIAGTPSGTTPTVAISLIERE